MDQMTLGFDRKQAGTRSVEATCREWVDAVFRAVEPLGAGTPVDAELIRSWVGDPPHPNGMGAVLLALQRADVVRRVGYRIATRPQRHAAEIKTYQRT